MIAHKYIGRVVGMLGARGKRSRRWMAMVLLAVCVCLLAGGPATDRGFALAAGPDARAQNGPGPDANLQNASGPDANLQNASGGEYELSWWTSRGSSARFAGGSYSASVTASQAEASYWSGGAYTIRGGFWIGVPAVYSRYLPLVLRGL